MNKLVKIIKGLVIISAILLPIISFAQDTSVKYNLIQPLPGVQAVPDFPTWISIFIPFLLGLAGLLSLIQIVRGGIMRAVSGGNPTAVGDANDMIWQAILGLVLALSAYLILNTINPDLVNLKFEPLEIRIAPPQIVKTTIPEQQRPTLNQQCQIATGCETPYECSVAFSPPKCVQPSVPNERKPILDQDCRPVIGCKNQTPELLCEKQGTGEGAFYKCVLKTPPQTIQLKGKNQICDPKVSPNGGCLPEFKCKPVPNIDADLSTCQP